MVRHTPTNTATARGVTGRHQRNRQREPRLAPRDIVSKKQRSRMMRAVGQARTEEEEGIASILRSIGARFRRNDAGLPGTPDFVNRIEQWALFVHGCFWHGHLNCAVTKSHSKPRVPARNAEFWAPKLAANRRRDRRKADRLRAAGYRVMTIWGCSLRQPERLCRRLITFLDRGRVGRAR